MKKIKDFKIGFWNYVNFGVLDNKEAVRDWEELGMNLPMSFEFNAEKHDKSQMIELLDECHAKNMQVIVCDARTRFERLIENGEEAFRKGVCEAVADFASHPAVFGFHVGDEPNKNQWEAALTAYKIVREAAPHLTPFINMLPNWDDDDFVDATGFYRENYSAANADFMKRAGADLISYDYYGQLAYFDQEKYFDLYFKNLNIFRQAAEKNDGDFFCCPLCCSHWSLREPTEDELRWQISTAIAHGARGLMWFFIYERTLDGSFRYPPIDLFWNRTPMFDKVARENRIFNEFFAKRLAGYRLDKVWHHVKALGGTPHFVGTEELANITYVVNPVPTAVSRFVNEEGKVAYVLVNLSQNQPSKIQPHFTGALNMKGNNNASWFGPGQMCVFTEEGKL